MTETSDEEGRRKPLKARPRPEVLRQAQDERAAVRASISRRFAASLEHLAR